MLIDALNKLTKEIKSKAMEEKKCTCPIFRALEKQGLRWNPETEEIETKRWRAEEGERYYYIKQGEDAPKGYTERFDRIDTRLWESGNYFRTAGEAQKYANEFKRMLKERTLDKEE